MQLSETIYEYEPPVTSTNEFMKTVAAQHNSTHNPEVAGSNPVPATRQNGPRRTLRGPFSCDLVTPEVPWRSACCRGADALGADEQSRRGHDLAG